MDQNCPHILCICIKKPWNLELQIRHGNSFVGNDFRGYSFTTDADQIHIRIKMDLFMIMSVFDPQISPSTYLDRKVSSLEVSTLVTRLSNSIIPIAHSHLYLAWLTFTSSNIFSPNLQSSSRNDISVPGAPRSNTEHGSDEEKVAVTFFLNRHKWNSGPTCISIGCAIHTQNLLEHPQRRQKPWGAKSQVLFVVSSHVKSLRMARLCWRGRVSLA